MYYEDKLLIYFLFQHIINFLPRKFVMNMFNQVKSQLHPHFHKALNKILYYCYRSINFHILLGLPHFYSMKQVHQIRELMCIQLVQLPNNIKLHIFNHRNRVLQIMNVDILIIYPHYLYTVN